MEQMLVAHAYLPFHKISDLQRYYVINILKNADNTSGIIHRLN
jgi:hypothetical protein